MSSMAIVAIGEGGTAKLFGRIKFMETICVGFVTNDQSSVTKPTRMISSQGIPILRVTYTER